MYGRTETKWSELEAAGWEFLVSRARKPHPITTYTELNAVLTHQIGQPPWDFDRQADRAAMGEPLGRLTDRSFAETRNRPGGGLMISALCMYLDQNDVGQGFYGKAAELQLIPTEHLQRDAKDEFWINQMNGVVEWGSQPMRRVKASTRQVLPGARSASSTAVVTSQPDMRVGRRGPRQEPATPTRCPPGEYGPAAARCNN